MQTIIISLLVSSPYIQFTSLFKPFIPSLRILLRVSHEQKFQQEWFDLLDLTHDDFIICNDDAIIFSGIIQADNSSNSFCRMSMQYILDNYILPISIIFILLPQICS